MKQEWFGTKTVNNNLVCAVCGKHSMQADTYIDGFNYYIQSGKCTECGNPISVKGTYEPDDDAYQEGEEE